LDERLAGLVGKFRTQTRHAPLTHHEQTYSQRSFARTSPKPDDMPSLPTSKVDELSPAKRRTAKQLDLSESSVKDNELRQLQRLQDVLQEKRKIVVIVVARYANMRRWDAPMLNKEQRTYGLA